MESESMAETSETSEHQLAVNGKLKDEEWDLLSPWPELAGYDHDTAVLDLGEYSPPEELRLLLDEDETPPQVQNILLGTLGRLKAATFELEQPSNQNELRPRSDSVETGTSTDSSQPTPVLTSSNDSRSSSTSATLLSRRTSQTSNRSQEAPRHKAASKNAALHAFRSTTVTIFGSVKQAIKDSSPTDKKSGSEWSHSTAKPCESECAACLESVTRRDMFNLKCTHSYCSECFTKMITTAIRNESMFPPRCCLRQIPFKEVFAVLDKHRKEVYRAKAAEFSLKPEDRWYCPNAECGNWVPPSKLHSKLHRLRIRGPKCPSCETKICGHCRGKSHEAGVQCPEDYGLEATLEEAERQGWRRCYQCKALVELTVGCRHITCKCRAQFCYTCGAKWRTCSCTEADQQRRQAEIVERRNARDARSRREDEETAQAIAAVEAMERLEAEEAAREAAARERREALQQAVEERERSRREHLERLVAQKQRIEGETTAKRREEAVRASIKERVERYQGALVQIQQLQQASLISRHHSEVTALNKEVDEQEALEKGQLRELGLKLTFNARLRRAHLVAAQAAAVAELRSKHEGEEDDTFISMQEHLRGRPNREARIKTAIEKLQKRRQGEMDHLVQEHDVQIKKLSQDVTVERNALEAGFALKTHDRMIRCNDATSRLHCTVAAERKWFEVVTERRRVGMEEVGRQLWDSIRQQAE